ncbi:MAG: transaldolase family protein [Coriobacteriales bacterium]|nr:transaldolase family protein [Coriobacteriales bacterium]
MKFFVDTADPDEIREAATWGVLAGVTTNPSLYARIGGKLADFPSHIQQICSIVDGPVSVEAVGNTRDELVAEGLRLAALAENVVIKLPIGTEGLAACRILTDQGIAVNMTLVFSVPQAVLAARAGASYISPFVGRFDDIGEDGISQLADIIDALSNYDWRGFGINDQEPQVIAASIRSVHHVTQAALLGADIATIPFAVLKKCLDHPLTEQGLAAFAKDWEKVIA